MALRDWPTRNLQNLERTGALRPEPADAGEVQRYLASADAFLADARRQANSVQSRFSIAYNAAHGFAVVALRANDYRTASEKGHRRLVFELLPSSCAAERGDSLVLVRAHEKRNQLEYEGMSEITEREVEDLVATVARIKACVQKWLARRRPELLK